MFSKDVVYSKQFFSWANLDFANSGYTTVVLTTIFNAYFVATIMQGSSAGTFAWTVILSISYLFVMLSAPWIGAYADCKGAHRKILVIATILCSVATFLLAFTKEGDLVYAAVFLIISNIAYSVHQDITAAYITKFGDDTSLGRISGLAWGWGFVGGLFTLLLSLFWIEIASQSVGKHSMHQKVGGAMIITALVFGGVSLSALLNLRSMDIKNADLNWIGAWSRFVKKMRGMTKDKNLKNFLICVLFYQSGIAAIITVAAIYAKEVMLFSISETIFLILIVNVSSCIGALVFGWVQDSVGYKKSIRAVLLIWIFMSLLLLISESELMFWLAANLAGLAMGSSQSAARAAVAIMSPLNRQAENFGLWGFFVNAASVIGPISYGITTLLTNNNHKSAIFVVSLYFVASILILEKCEFKRTLES